MFSFIFSLLIGALAGSIAGRIMGSETKYNLSKKEEK